MKKIDEIKEMNSHEMAEFLEKVFIGDRKAIGIDCGQTKCESWKCTECIERFLDSTPN